MRRDGVGAWPLLERMVWVDRFPASSRPCGGGLQAQILDFGKNKIHHERRPGATSRPWAAETKRQIARGPRRVQACLGGRRRRVGPETQGSRIPVKGRPTDRPTAPRTYARHHNAVALKREARAQRTGEETAWGWRGLGSPNSGPSTHGVSCGRPKGTAWTGVCSAPYKDARWGSAGATDSGDKGDASGLSPGVREKGGCGPCAIASPSTRVVLFQNGGSPEASGQDGGGSGAVVPYGPGGRQKVTPERAD